MKSEEQPEGSYPALWRTSLTAALAALDLPTRNCYGEKQPSVLSESLYSDKSSWPKSEVINHLAVLQSMD